MIIGKLKRIIPGLLVLLFIILLASTSFIKVNKDNSGQNAIQEFQEIIFATRKMAKDGHWYANFGYYAFDPDDKLYTSGSTLSKLNIQTGKLTILFHDPEGTFRDPQLHYDGQKLIFSYRKGGSEHFHLYETDINGSYQKQLTSGPYTDIEPTYLPDGDIMFVSTRCECWVNCWSSQVATIHRCKPDGSGITKISANIEHDNTPWLLPDGRIMYTRWEYVDRSQVHFHHLWAMNPDGTRQNILFGNQITGFQNPGSCLLIDAKPVPWSRDTIIATYSPGHGRKEHGGYPVLIALNNGPDDKDAYHFIGRGSKGPNLYDPYAINPDLFMVSEDDKLILFKRNGKEKFSFNLPSNFVEEDQLIFEPRPVMPRQMEPVVATSTDNSIDYGTIILQNAYQGRNMYEVEDQSIKKLLVLETLRKPINYTGGNEPLSYTGSFTMERIVGTVPVREDGSAHFKLPANRPYLFVALNEKEQVVQKMKSFTSVAPGEVISCIGCHEKRSLAPENRGHIPLALNDEAHFPEKIDELPAVIDFPRDIQPILDKNCIECHNSNLREGGVLLTGDHGPIYSHSYFNLMARFQVNDGLNHNFPLNKPGMVGDTYSPIMKKIEEGHGSVTLTEEELRMLRFWINTGALYPGTYGALGTGMLGVMTNNQANQHPIENDQWDKASNVIKKKCMSCHNELRPNILDENNLTWWCSRVEVSRGSLEMEKYEEAIRFSRHILYNLSVPEESTILKAPLASEAGGYGLCTTPSGKPVFQNKKDKSYITLLNAIGNSSNYLEKVKRFDMEGFIVRPDYYREMIRFGVIEEGTPIETVNPYVTDSIYWSQQ